MTTALKLIVGVVGAFLVIGCGSPTPINSETLTKRSNLPESWVYLSSSSHAVRQLPPGLQVNLKQLRSDLINEQQGQYFAFHGDYKPETLRRIDAMNRACNEAYMVSARVLASDLTPEMASVAQTQEGLWWQDQALYNIQWREFVDDWNTVWLLDQPSRLSSYPIVDTSRP